MIVPPGAESGRRRPSSTRPPTSFAIGQVVCVLESDERAVVIDIDFRYQPSDDWPPELVADLERAASDGEDRPWIRMLVDGGGEAYLRDDRIAPDEDPQPIRHPDLEHHFDLFIDGYYARTRGLS